MPEHDADNLMLRYLDGLVTPDEAESLNRQLRADPGAQDRFIELTLRFALLHDAMQGHGVVDSGPRVQQSPTPTLRPFRGRSVWYTALAAAIALAVTVWFVFISEPRTPNPEPSGSGIALLTNVNHAVFADGSQHPQLGAALSAGTLSLISGSAQVMFDSGAVVDLHGPCTFAMTEPNRGHLLRGAIQAYVPDTAHGFTVAAPHYVRVIDLGTRFAMHVDAAGVSDVRVLDGTVMVEVDRPDVDKSYALLTANQRMHLDPTLSVEQSLRVIERPPLAEALAGADLRIDLQPDYDDCRTPDGFAAMAMPLDNLPKGDLPWSQRLDLASVDGGEIVVSIDTTDDSTLDFRRRPDVTGTPLGRMLEDQVKNQQGGLTLTLSGLPAGVWRVVSWHHDAGGGAVGNEFDVRVSDARGAERLMHVGQVVSGGASVTAPTVSDFDVFADGEGPITITFDPTTEDPETPCNGLTLRRLVGARRTAAQP